jgi:acid-sensing ion channel, other
MLTDIAKTYRFSICKFWAFTVHSPFELASSYDDDTEVCDLHVGADMDVLITPEIIRTDEALRSYEPKKRGCYFEDERKLKFFNIYTRKNCEYECFASVELTRGMFNCKPFYMPRENSTLVCDHRAEYFIQNEKYFFDTDYGGMLSNCSCLEACNSIKYDVEIFERKRSDHNSTLDMHQVSTDVTINFKIKDVEIMPMVRYQPLTFVEFLAQSGGMMGLFACLLEFQLCQSSKLFTFSC